MKTPQRNVALKLRGNVKRASKATDAFRTRKLKPAYVQSLLNA